MLDSPAENLDSRRESSVLQTSRFERTAMMQDTLDIIRKSSEMTTDIKRLAKQIERKEKLTKT